MGEFVSDFGGCSYGTLLENCPPCGTWIRDAGNGYYYIDGAYIESVTYSGHWDMDYHHDLSLGNPDKIAIFSRGRVYGDQTVYHKMLLVNSNGGIVGGYKQRGVTTKLKLLYSTGFGNDISMSGGGCHSIVILEINRKNNRYSKLTINDVDRSDEIEDIDLPEGTRYPITRFEMFSAATVNNTYSVVDYVGAYTIESNKYLKFPRWQKTKYGMRPFY